MNKKDVVTTVAVRLFTPEERKFLDELAHPYGLRYDSSQIENGGSITTYSNGKTVMRFEFAGRNSQNAVRDKAVGKMLHEKFQVDEVWYDNNLLYTSEEDSWLGKLDAFRTKASSFLNFLLTEK